VRTGIGSWASSIRHAPRNGLTARACPTYRCVILAVRVPMRKESPMKVEVGQCAEPRHAEASHPRRPAGDHAVPPSLMAGDRGLAVLHCSSARRVVQPSPSPNPENDSGGQTLNDSTREAGRCTSGAARQSPTPAGSPSRRNPLSAGGLISKTASYSLICMRQVTPFSREIWLRRVPASAPLRPNG
jgi:hypothetical protein